MAALNMSDTYELVCEVWRSAIPHTPFDPGLSLSECGADSLKVMGMVLRLEMALGRSVPLELLHSDTSARSLADGLSAAAGTTAVNQRQRVFVLPGIGGDQMMLAAIRRALSRDLQFELIRYPDPDPSSQPDLDGLAAEVAGQIAACQPAGPVGLMGYSFGGILAAEVARHLRRHGRQVSLMILLDAIPVRSAGRRLFEFLGQPRLLSRKLARRLRALHTGWKATRPGGRAVFLAQWAGAYGILAGLHRRTDTLDGAGTGDADRFRGWKWRADAMRRWQPERLAVQALLIMSEDGAFARIDRLWSRLIPDLSVRRIDVDHGGLGTGDALKLIIDAVRQELASPRQVSLDVG